MLDVFRVIIEQWIRAKYERQEFIDVRKQVYLHGQKTGHLWKRDKREDKFAKRLFVLNEATNTLIYFNKEDVRHPSSLNKWMRV